MENIKENNEKIAKFLDLVKIKAYDWVYHPKFGDTAWLEDVWVDKNVSLFYKTGDKHPYLFNFSDEEDEPTTIIPSKKELTYHKSVDELIPVINKIISENNNIVINNGIVVITDLKETRVFISREKTILENLYNTIIDYIDSKK